jgi:hypothetical protein
MKDLKEFLQTDEAKRIKQLEANMGLKLNGMMQFAYGEWLKEQKK